MKKSIGIKTLDRESALEIAKVINNALKEAHKKASICIIDAEGTIVLSMNTGVKASTIDFTLISEEIMLYNNSGKVIGAISISSLSANDADLKKPIAIKAIENIGFSTKKV